MQLEGGKLDNLHLAFLIMGFTIGASIVLVPGSGAGQEAWLTILAGLAGGLLFAYIFFSLACKFPQKNLVEINDSIYGSSLGKVISLLYLGYFLQLGSLILRNFGDFLIITFYRQTPIIIFIGLMALIAASAVRNGIEVITRSSIILVFSTFIIFLLDFSLLLPQVELGKLLPILELPLKDFVKISFSVAAFPFGESVVFLMVTSSLNKNLKNMKKYALASLIIPGIIFTIISIRNASVLGATALISLYPSHEAIQLIEVGDIITRMEIIFTVNMLTMGFIKLCVMYYGVVLGTAQLLNLRSYLPLVLPIGIIMIVLSIIQFENAGENLAWSVNIYPWFALPFQFIIPLLSLILVLLKGNKVNKKAGESA